MPSSRGLTQEAPGHEGKIVMPLTETAVGSFLRATAPSLAKLQVPRDQLSEVLEQIHKGSCGNLYRATMITGDPPRPKRVVLKALKGKMRRLPAPFYFSSVNANKLCKFGIRF